MVSQIKKMEVESRMLRKVWLIRANEGRSNWSLKKLHNEEIHVVYSSINKLSFFLCRNSLLSQMSFHCVGRGVSLRWSVQRLWVSKKMWHQLWKRNAYRVMFRKYEVKISLWRPKCRWKNKISIYPQEIRFESVELIHLF